MTRVPAVFVAHEFALTDKPGGVQVCTREFHHTLNVAGYDMSVVPIQFDRSLPGRLRQRLHRRAYPLQWHSTVVDAVVDATRARGANVVFLNLVNLAPMAEALRRRLGATCRLVLLSHGLESVDFVHEHPHRDRQGECRLGRLIYLERAQRQFLSHVVCVNPFEVEIERWLGAKQVDWVARTVPQRSPLAWSPHAERFGFVGTLDHPPNRDGLIAFLQALAHQRQSARIRVVGGPEADGQALAARFSSVDYLGALGDAELEVEAASWSAFLHPLFCWARGVSTKLATALAWQLPIVTTDQGVRGYLWKEGGPDIVATADECAARAVQLLDPSTRRAARERVAAAGATSPSVGELATKLRAMIEA